MEELLANVHAGRIVLETEDQVRERPRGPESRDQPEGLEERLPLAFAARQELALEVGGPMCMSNHGGHEAVRRLGLGDVVANGPAFQRRVVPGLLRHLIDEEGLAHALLAYDEDGLSPRVTEDLVEAPKLVLSAYEDGLGHACALSERQHSRSATTSPTSHARWAGRGRRCGGHWAILRDFRVLGVRYAAWRT